MDFRRLHLALPSVLALSLIDAGPANAANLSLRLVGLTPRGQVSVAIFDNKANWDRRKAPLRTVTETVNRETLELSVELPPGAYGVMVFHDRNANGRLDTLPIGLPTEPYGFSNDSRGTFGPPDWRDAVFSLSEAGVRMTLRLR